MKRKVVLAALCGTIAAASASAFAGNFGPGNSGGSQTNKSPSEQKCHPPGQTTEEPGCK
jgi:hypothetical protein